MKELKEWINASAANKKHFQSRLDRWATAHQEESSLFDHQKAFQRFKNRVHRAEQLIDGIDQRPLPQIKVHARNHKRLLTKITSYAAVLLLAAGLIYFLQKGRLNLSPSSKTETSVAYIDIKVPPGAREKYTLPDKSVVWLNAGTTFKYPASFSGQTREVFLNGEGYFQVAKDAKHPFIVNTVKGNITVTGTTFNVYSYDLKPQFITALLEGHVHVNTPDGQLVNLLPSQKAELNKGRLNVSPVIDPDQYRWMEGLICFENERITDVLENLENSFGQKISVKHLDNPDLLLTGKFRVSDGLAYALKILSEGYGITYKTDTTGDGYIIIN